MVFRKACQDGQHGVGFAEVSVNLDAGRFVGADWLARGAGRPRIASNKGSGKTTSWFDGPIFQGLGGN